MSKDGKCPDLYECRLGVHSRHIPDIKEIERVIILWANGHEIDFTYQELGELLKVLLIALRKED